MLSKTKFFMALFSITLVASVGTTSDAHAKKGSDRWPPTFDQYPATASLTKKLTFDRYGCGRRFRDSIKHAIRTEGINLAGDSVLVEWGCGTYCQSHGIVYGQTGKVNCNLPTTQVGAKSRKNSKLIICNPPELLKTVPGDERKYFNETQYFLWDDGKLTELTPPSGKGRKFDKERKHHK